ncbi:MAG: hypothetical protein AAGA54_07765 [Myxococcota bacterium]
MTNPFEFVRWEKPPDDPRELSPAQFLEVSLTERVRALLGTQLTFYEEGRVLDAKVALDRLSKLGRAAARA